VRPAALALGAFLFVSLPAAAQQLVTERPWITDGDTIRIGATRVRLWGIDAPETTQSCDDNHYPAGLLATVQLARLMSGHKIECEDRGKDRYGRTIGLCRADGVDVSAEMVRQGWAWAFLRYSSDYVAQEREAREAKRGVYAHNCKVPWDWRAAHREHR